VGSDGPNTNGSFTGALLKVLVSLFLLILLILDSFFGFDSDFFSSSELPPKNVINSILLSSTSELKESEEELDFGLSFLTIGSVLITSSLLLALNISIRRSFNARLSLLDFRPENIDFSFSISLAIRILSASALSSSKYFTKSPFLRPNLDPIKLSLAICSEFKLSVLTEVSQSSAKSNSSEEEDESLKLLIDAISLSFSAWS